MADKYEKDIVDGCLRIVSEKTLKPIWGKRDFCLYNDDFVRARSQMSEKMNRCYCCNWPFQIGTETVAIVCFNQKIGNKTVCQECFDQLVFIGGE
ncbi:hypothetical protein [Vibrio fluvialis]|uniref:hypothetical protein n=1 Tax=Vibrio fluvialis TaxID=676 RepID=UPI001C9C5F18|nr:hypothetical protein [Vibrio fluvialis]MBY8132145.1 hypothetical protein [Vibrio fluvialis]